MSISLMKEILSMFEDDAELMSFDRENGFCFSDEGCRYSVSEAIQLLNYKKYENEP